MPAPPRRIILSLSLGLAFVVLGAGLLGVAAQVPALATLATPVAGWPALNLPGSLILAATGIGLVGHLTGRRRLAQWASGFALLLSLLSLLGRAGWYDLPGGNIALAAATLLTAGAAGLFLAGAADRPEDASLALGVSGFTVLALSGTFLLARATGVLDPLVDPSIAGVSAQAVGACLLLGICYLLLAWYPGIAASAGWLPWAAGVAGAVTVIVLGQALLVRERAQMLALAGQAADAEARSLAGETAVITRALLRAADWRVNRATRQQRDANLDALRRDLRGLEAGFWLWADGRPSERLTGDSVIPAPDSAWHAYADRLRPLPDSAVILPLDDAAVHFLIVAPGCRDGACPGAVGGVMRAEWLFAEVLGDRSRGFRFSISYAGRLVGGAPTPLPDKERFARAVPLELGGARYILTAWPTAETLERTRSSLPKVVMVLGILLSALLALVIHLGQRAWRTARDSERGRLALALERSTDGIWEWDLLTGSAVRSEGMLRYLGYEAQSLPELPQTWLGLIHPEDRPRVEEALRAHLDGEAPNFEAEYRVRSSSGRWHSIVDRGRVTDRDATGRPLRILGISADVTETRAIQAAHQAGERRFREMFDSGFQPKLLVDPSGTVMEVNRAALDAVPGSSGSAIIGRPVQEVLWWALDPATGPRLAEAMGRALQDGGRVVRYEEEVQAADGGVTLLEIGVKRIDAAAGETAQLLIEARDTTARRRAEAALQEVDMLTTMGRVAARVAHEINNPLAGIQNAFLLIKGAIPPDHPHVRYVGAIDREIGRIAAVTRQLYETYRPEADQTGETSVRTVLGDAVAFLEQVNRASQVQITLSADQVPTVIGVPSSMLRQIAYNLVQNAVDASPPGSEVTVVAGVEEGRLVLGVRDHGPGVPPELRERIFEPFFSTKDKRIRTSGMGIGLALVRRTVTAAGGTITVQDPAGGGSEFVVRIPLQARKPERTS